MQTCSWKPSPGMGRGLFAEQTLPPGTLIMRDVEAMKIPNVMFRSDNTRDLDPVQEAFHRLSLKEQSDFMQLHEGDQLLPSKVARIWKANAFVSQDDEYSFMYLNICKANHSCSPNAEIIPHEDMSPSKPRLVAIKHIPIGTEIFITYSAYLNMKPRAERREWLRQNFDFDCSCALCSGDPHAVFLSDARRILLSVVCPAVQDLGVGRIPQLEAMRKQAFSRSLPEAAVKWQSLLQTSPMMVKCSLNLLIARIFEAEGLLFYQAGSAYLNAATLLLSQMRERDDGIILLGAAENVKTWTKEGRRIIITLHGPNSSRGKEIIEYASNLEERIFVLCMAKDFHERRLEMEAVAHHNRDAKLLKKLREAFALQFVFQEDGNPNLKVISEDECKVVVRQHRVNPAAKLEGSRAMRAYMEA